MTDRLHNKLDLSDFHVLRVLYQVVLFLELRVNRV